MLQVKFPSWIIFLTGPYFRPTLITVICKLLILHKIILWAFSKIKQNLKLTYMPGIGQNSYCKEKIKTLQQKGLLKITDISQNFWVWENKFLTVILEMTFHPTL